MTYKWARDRTLELIDQYSVAGTEVPASYNNQADYLHKIPGLLDDAALTAATGPHRMRTSVRLADLESREEGTWTVYTMPGDCWQLCGSGLLVLEEGAARRFHRYLHVGGDTIAVPAHEVPENAVLEYWRYPVLLGESPAEDAPLDNDQVTQRALPFFAAARLVMLDNAFAYSALMNEFESRLAMGTELPQIEWSVVEDAYQSQ